MSKVIGFFAIFVVIIACSAVFFLPKTLISFENGIISGAEKNGFLLKIGNTSFSFPDKIVFENAEVLSILNNDFSAKISHTALDFSLTDYIKSLFKSNRTISDFSNTAQLSDISLFFQDTEILPNAKAVINFTSDNLKYKISADRFNYGDFNASKITIDGTFDSTKTDFTANIEIFGGLIKFIADYDLQRNHLELSKIALQDIDLPQILPDDVKITGKLSGEIIPRALPHNFSNFDEILENTEAECVLSIKNFGFEDKKISKPILDAVYFVGINDLNFREITANFDYSHSNLRVKNLRADNFKYAVELNGFFIPKTQRFDFNTEIRFNPDMHFAIQRNVWNAMTRTEPNNQGRKITGKISGNGSDISVSLDSEIMRRGVNSILSEIKNIFR